MFDPASVLTLTGVLLVVVLAGMGVRAVLAYGADNAEAAKAGR